MPEDEPLIDTKAAAKMLGIAPGTLVLWRTVRKGDQPAYIKLRKAVRYRPSVIRDWIASRGVPATSPR